METAPVLNYLEGLIHALRIDGISCEHILRENEPAEFEDAELYFEISVSEMEIRLDVECGREARCKGCITICGVTGEGISRVDTVARGLLDLLRTDSAAGWRPLFAANSRVWPEGSRRVLIYGGNAKRSAGRNIDGRYKASVVIDFTIYEED